MPDITGNASDSSPRPSVALGQVTPGDGDRSAPLTVGPRPVGGRGRPLAEVEHQAAQLPVRDQPEQHPAGSRTERAQEFLVLSH